MGISGKATGVVIGLVTIMIVMFLYGNISPTLIEATSNITSRVGSAGENDSVMPLSGLFSATGVVLILVAIGVFLGIMKLAMGGKK